jgi:hypothetical protein
MADRGTLCDWFEEDRPEHRCDGTLDEVIEQIAERTEATLGEPLVRAVDNAVICFV